MYKIILCRFPMILVALGLGISNAALAVENMGQPYVETSQYQRVNDVDIYYGVMPAQIAGKFSSIRAEPEMHGGAPSAGRNEYHLVVALFDAGGNRIVDAKVSARVRELGMNGARKALEPMQIGDVTTFGNYFMLRQGGIYRLEIGVARPAKPGAQNIQATFEYRLQ
ncbi:MAG TPA: hypothetical protein VFR06_01250 [Gallionellaceae bacterium]|nr:hypothetical protein [Gallionellaceae bacterium]